MAVYLNCYQWFYIINNHSSFFYLKWCPFSRIISFGQTPRHRNKRSEGMNVLRLLITAANAFLMGPFNFTPHVQMPSLPVPLSLVPFAQAQCFLDPQSPYLWDETNDSALPVPWAGDTSDSEVLTGKRMLFYPMSYLYNMAPDYMGLKPTSVTQELCVFGQVANLSVPQFPHLQNKSEENNSKLHPSPPEMQMKL